MPRIFIILACATVLVFRWMFYQYSAQQKEAAQFDAYQVFFTEKTGTDISAGTRIGKNQLRIDLSDVSLKG